jgi:hypothetical protein
MKAIYLIIAIIIITVNLLLIYLLYNVEIQSQGENEIIIFNALCIDGVLKVSYFDGIECKYIDVHDKDNNIVRCD